MCSWRCCSGLGMSKMMDTTSKQADLNVLCRETVTAGFVGRLPHGHVHMHTLDRTAVKP